MVHTSSLKAASSNYSKTVLCRVKSRWYKIDKITTATSIRHFWKAAFLISNLSQVLWQRRGWKSCQKNSAHTLPPAWTTEPGDRAGDQTHQPQTKSLFSKSPAAEERPRVSPKHKWEYLNLDGSTGIKTIGFNDSMKYTYVLWLSQQAVSEALQQ